MAYINFENLPSTTTPLNATNLRSMQVEDSGSNSRGNWIKYNDGTLIQWNNFTTSDQAINEGYGNTNLYTKTRTVNLPISFIDANYSASCGTFKWGTSASWGTVDAYSKNWITLRAYDYYSREAGTDCYISWLAIGKWK